MGYGGLRSVGMYRGQPLLRWPGCTGTLEQAIAVLMLAPGSQAVCRPTEELLQTLRPRTGAPGIPHQREPLMEGHSQGVRAAEWMG